MENKMNRRDMLGVTAAVGGAAAGASILGATTLMAATPASTTLPWPYLKLKVAKVTERAYESSWKYGCMYGVVEAVLGELADKKGAPYNTFPVDVTAYGGGGVGAVGTICGALNGAALVIGLFAKTPADRTAMIQEICLWYETTALPIMKPKSPHNNIPMPKSKSASPLCHVSLSEWSSKSGYKVGTAPHPERCYRLTADVTKKVVEMLNDYIANKFVAHEKLNAFSTGCLACHGVGKLKANAYAKMNCNTCHEDPH